MIPQLQQKQKDYHSEMESCHDTSARSHKVTANTGSTHLGITRGHWGHGENMLPQEPAAFMESTQFSGLSHLCVLFAPNIMSL